MVSVVLTDKLSPFLFVYLSFRYARNWQYHKDECIWMKRAPGMNPTKQENCFEELVYCYLDVNTWKKAYKEFRVEYNRLEDHPQAL